MFTEENTELVSDNMYFYRICQNLIENALKYSAKGTRVFVKNISKRREVVFGDHEHGGISDGGFTKEDIIERFSRGRSGEK